MRGDYFSLIAILSMVSVTMLYLGSQTNTTYVYDTASNLQKRFRTKLTESMPTCCKALTKECLSCAAGMLVKDFCDRHKGEYGCPNVTVTLAPVVEKKPTTTPKPIIKVTEFKRNYRARYIAQAKQDRYVDNLFKDKKLSKGVFVEFGGLKGDEYSNTWYFEKAYNWHGIMIEAEKKFIPHLKKVRPNCKIYNNAVCPTGVKEVTFASSKIAGWSGILNSYEDPRWHAQVGKTFHVKCVDLNVVLKENNFHHIDYMTVDTEGSEIEILETFQFHRFDIAYIQVERNVKTQKQRERRDYLIELMKKNGYLTKKVFDIGNNAVDILFEKRNYNTVLISTDRTKTFGIKKRIQQSLNYFTETYDEVKKQFPDVNIHVDHKTDLYRGIRVKEWRPRKKSYDFVTRYAALIYANTLKSYSTDLLVFEDDLFISDNLRERIDWAVGFLYSSGITNFIIDCHNVAGRKVKKHHETLFEIKFAYATQCMYYSSAAISKVVQSIENKKVPYDHAIRDSNIPCYAFDKSMIYHRGEKSTGLAGLHISKVRNPTFVKSSCPFTPPIYRNNNGGWYYTKDLIKREHVKFDKGFGNELRKMFKGKKVIDLGAGVGQFGVFLKGSDINWVGFDGGNNIEDFVGKNTPLRDDPKHVVPPMCWIDLSTPVKLEKGDWVVSIEVGEHIDAKYEHVFLDNIANAAKTGVVLTWAIKGQGGFQHVNERDNEYIIDQMKQRGMIYDKKTSTSLRKSVLNHWWLRKTIMVFKKKSRLTNLDIFTEGCTNRVYMISTGEIKEIKLKKCPSKPNINNKNSCAIVGNSPSILNHEYGNEIDQHDIVLRFNGVLPKYPKHQGTKTSLQSSWGNWRSVVEKANNIPLLYGTWSQNDVMELENVNVHFSLLTNEFMKIVREYYKGFCQPTECNKNSPFPSSGLVHSIALSHLCEKTIMYGFKGDVLSNGIHEIQNMKTPTNNLTEFRIKTKGVHNYEIERRIIKDLVERNMVIVKPS